MRKRVLLALVLVLALLASTGCSLIVKDPEVDKQTVVIEAAGQTFTKGEVQQQTDYLLDYYAYMYSMYGMPFDANDKEFIASVRDEAIDAMVKTAVLEKKITEMGLDQFSAEETAEMETYVDEQYNSYVEFVKSYSLADTELTADELQAAIDEAMISMGYGTREQMLEDERLLRAQDKLREAVVSTVAVTEEELQSEYNFLMGNARATYTEYPEAYGVDLTNGTVGMYYAPAGYRYVKHILVSFNEEDQAAIDELSSELSALQNDPDADEKTVAAFEADLAAASEKAAAAIQPVIDEIQAKLAAGESFETLMDEYNQDPGMTSDSIGYAVCAGSTNWVQEFTDASMALEAIGDVSAPVRSSYGIHLIQYASDIPEGEIGLENVREELTADLLAAKQDTVYEETLTQWAEEADAKVYTDRL